MSNSNHIVLLDPALQDNNGTDSENMGDLIISEAIRKTLSELFPQKEIIRVSVHVPLLKKEKDIVNNSFLSFVGGTNILTSDIRNFERLVPRKRKGFYLSPGFSRLILMGTGWSGYSKRPDLPTTVFYRRILSKQFYHSLRDNYSVNQLGKVFISKKLHTSCPTVWEFDTSFTNKFDSKLNKILFSLTDYNTDPGFDNSLLRLLLDSEQQEIFFFPQSRKDIPYLLSLDNYKKNKSRFVLLNHSYKEYNEFVTGNRFNYIGTRLHGGIRCLQEKNPALIIGIDNRAMEMRKSIQLNVADKNDWTTIKNWIFKEIAAPVIQLPLDNIIHWKKQFSSYI